MKKMVKQKTSFYERLLVVFSYVLFFPAFNIIFTERRRNEELAFHAGQAMFLWIFIILVIASIRIVLGLIFPEADIAFAGYFVAFLSFILWAYAVKCSFVFLMGKKVVIPVISYISDRLA